MYPFSTAGSYTGLQPQDQG